MGIVIYEGIDYLMGIVIVICVIYALSKLSSKLLNTMNEAVIYVWWTWINEWMNEWMNGKFIQA